MSMNSEWRPALFFHSLRLSTLTLSETPNKGATPMRRSTESRLLSNEEWALARQVFTVDTLPPWSQILVRNGLGLQDRPWTNHESYAYEMMLGDVFGQDLTKRDWTSRWLNGDYGRLCELFIHEMVHVWQYFRGYRVKN